MDEALAKKLMLHKFDAILLPNRPAGVAALDGLPYDTAPGGTYDLIFRFTFSLEEMKEAILSTAAGGLLRPAGYLYLAYPKKGNKQYPHIDRDSLFPYLDVDEETGFACGTALKFSKMVALDDVFTLVGLKHTPGAAGRAASAAASQKVDDYADKVPVLRETLSKQPAILAIYDALAPGYQKDWARYIYSAKTDATREKRLLEAADLLAAGYKSKALARQGKK